MYTLNVGGTVFTCSADTIRSLTDTRYVLDRILHDGNILELGKNGQIFVDRDPRWFPYILQYIRDHQEVVITPDLYTLYNVQSEFRTIHKPPNKHVFVIATVEEYDIAYKCANSTCNLFSLELPRDDRILDILKIWGWASTEKATSIFSSIGKGKSVLLSINQTRKEYSISECPKPKLYSPSSSTCPAPYPSLS